MQNLNENCLILQVKAANNIPVSIRTWLFIICSIISLIQLVNVNIWSSLLNIGFSHHAWEWQSHNRTFASPFCRSGDIGKSYSPNEDINVWIPIRKLLGDNNTISKSTHYPDWEILLSWLEPNSPNEDTNRPDNKPFCINNAHHGGGGGSMSTELSRLGVTCPNEDTNSISSPFNTIIFDIHVFWALSNQVRVTC